MDKNLRARIENDFAFHPVRPGQAQRYEEVRAMGKTMALRLEELCLPSRELSSALTKIEEAVFWACAAIARNECV